MKYHPLLIYAHILLMVFWLGTDVGVFIAGLFFIDPHRSLERRRAAIELGLIVDRFPRICFVLMLPPGKLQLAWQMGVPAGLDNFYGRHMGREPGLARRRARDHVRARHTPGCGPAAGRAWISRSPDHRAGRGRLPRLRGTAPGWLLGKLLA